MARPTRLAAATLFLAACSDRPAAPEADSAAAAAAAPSAEHKKNEVVAKKVVVENADGSVEGDDVPSRAADAADVPVIRLTLSNLASALGE